MTPLKSAFINKFTRYTIALLLCMFTLSSLHANELTAYQDVPKQWRTEIIPFPLNFASQIPLIGVEELVFAPGMYDASKQDFFSYAFVWAVSSTTIDTQTMQQYIHQYYLGLYKAVSGKHQVAKDEVKVTLTGSKDNQFYSGYIDWIEPFVSQQPQRLFFETHQQTCEKTQQIRWYFTASPQVNSHIIWQHLSDLSKTHC
ncbi:hypothetical protein [Shewanella maritima]|uniref:hypothetical protein n=1 Tax=Shewanella maritima TaxID=2520507 RepID=UPI003736A03F